MYITREEITYNIFNNLATDPIFNPVNHKILCSRATFFRRYKMYGELPAFKYYGCSTGSRLIIVDLSIKELNKYLKNTIRLSENNALMGDHAI